MTTEVQRNVFGFDATIRVQVPPVVDLSPGMHARLEHQCELALRGLARRLCWYVIDWPKRRATLRRMTAADAELLGLLPEWRRAKDEIE